MSRVSNLKYLEFVRSLPCSHCGTDQGIQAHHIIGIGVGVMGGKADDIHTCPLCHTCHQEVHRTGPHKWPQIKWMLNAQHWAQIEGVLK